MTYLRSKSVWGAVLAAGVAFSAGSALAQGKVDLPSTIAWTAYDVGSAGYNQSVAIGKALKDAYGTDLRVLPGKNDVSRQVPLRAGKVHFSATGVGASFMAQEGVFEFGSKEWGPQENRVLLASNSEGNMSVGVAADIGIKTIADLKGKRVAWVVGAPALNENVRAILAFGGLTWDDVVKVEFGGFGPSWDGIVNGHGDKEGWKRLQANAPFFAPNMGTVGAGLSAEKPHEGAAYPYPILIAYPTQDKGLAYSMTKAMVEQFPKYKGAAPGINGWALDRQILKWAVPYHEGAIAYLKEAGVWKDAHQKHNDKLIERQQVLKKAWAEVTAKKIGDDEAFKKAWMEARAKALEAGGFDVVYR